jgi:hypothetical protein
VLTSGDARGKHAYVKNVKCADIQPAGCAGPVLSEGWTVHKSQVLSRELSPEGEHTCKRQFTVQGIMCLQDLYNLDREQRSNRTPLEEGVEEGYLEGTLSRVLPPELGFIRD